MPSAIAARYASAFFGHIQEAGDVNSVYGEITWLLKIIDDLSELQNFLKDPVITAEKRISIIDKTFKARVSAEVYKFLLFLIAKERLDYLRDICREFISLYRDRNNIISAVITSSVHLSDKNIKDLCLRLKSRFNKNILPELKVDTELLGGIRVQVGDQIIDHSIRYQLDAFEQSIAHI